MNKRGILCLAVFLLFFSSIAFTQTITVTSPNGGETLVRGETHTITWTSSGITRGTFTVLLFEGTTSIGTIERGIACSDGSHSTTWTVGNFMGGTAPNGSNYKIKVRQASESPKDFSNAAFTISGAADPDPDPDPDPGTDPGTPSITVTSPNGGESWQIGGASKNITWTSSGITSGQYKITLWKGDVQLGIIASNISHPTTSFNWTVGNLSDGSTVGVGTDYKIKVRQQSATPKDFSNSNFELNTGFTFTPLVTLHAIKFVTFTINAPDGRDLSQKSRIRILWRAQNIVARNTIGIDLYRGTTRIGKIAENLASGRISHEWTVGEYDEGSFAGPGSDFKIKVFIEGGSAFHKMSSPFRITDPKTVDLRCWVDSHQMLNGGDKVKLKIHVASNRLIKTLLNVPVECSVKVSGMSRAIDTKTHLIPGYSYRGSTGFQVVYITLDLGSYGEGSRRWDYEVTAKVDYGDFFNDKNRSNNTATYRFTY